ncbi:S8 family serine peptidase [Cytobacillus dafuensis]|nr:S8 family serine peptidase [Cytobacillus dafuensis]
MTVPANLINAIAELPGVYSVSPDFMVNTDPTDNGQDVGVYVTDDSTTSMGGMKESRSVLKTEELNHMGFDGTGVKVAVLDTGIDYNHPDLTGVYKGGHDYIGNPTVTVLPSGQLSMSNLNEDNDPMETTFQDWVNANANNGTPERNSGGETFYTSHGTHVAGTIAATGNNPSSIFDTLGIAPKADLYAYRVLGPYGSGPSAGIIKAIDQAVKDGMQVLNLSLGAPTDTAYDPMNIAVNNASIAGAIVCIAAGNNGLSPSGTRRAQSLGTPGTASLPITVAASNYGGGATKMYNAANVDNSATMAIKVTGSDMSNVFADNKITANNLNYVDGKGYQYTLVTGSGNTATSLDQLNALPDNSLAGQILVVKRGELTFTDIPPQAARLGAGAILIINKDTEEGFLPNNTISGEKLNSLPIFSITHQSGDSLASVYTTTVGQGNASYIDFGTLSLDDQPKTPASFSSIGPVSETAAIKPDITAPGVDIMSTQPAFLINPDHNATDYSNAYARMSGTSMATPHIAGIAALMRQNFPNAPVAEIKARLMNTANPTLINSGVTSAPTASVLEIGSGFVDPMRALVTDKDTIISVTDNVPSGQPGELITNQSLASLSFGTVLYSATGTVSTKKLPVTITNSGDNASRYTMSVTYNNDTNFSNSAAQNNVSFSMEQTSLTIQPGQSATFNTNMNIPKNCKTGRYEGYLNITGPSGNYVLPFMVYVTGVDASTLPFAIQNLWQVKPILTTSDPVKNGGIADSQHSGTAPFVMTYTGQIPGDKMSVYLLKKDSSTPSGYKIVGSYGDYLTSSLPAGDGRSATMFFAVQKNYYPIDESGNVANNSSIVPEGVYKLGLGLTVDGVKSVTAFGGGLVVDSTRPVLSFSTPLDFEFPSTTNVLSVKGNIYSHAAEVAQLNGVQNQYYAGSPVVSQRNNALMISKNNGLTYNYYLNCNANGDFVTQFSGFDGATTIKSVLASATDGYSGTYYKSTLPGYTYAETGNNRADGNITLRYTQSPALSSVSAKNGSVSATLAFNPRLVSPVAGDFKIEYSVNNGERKPIDTTFSYDSTNSTAHLDFTPIPSQPYDQDITVYLDYKGAEKSYTFHTKALTGTLVLDYYKFQDEYIEAGTFTTAGQKAFEIGNPFEYTKISAKEARTARGYRGNLIAPNSGKVLGTFVAKLDSDNKLSVTYKLYNGLKTTDSITFIYSPTQFTSKNYGQLIKDYKNSLQTQALGSATGTFTVNNVTSDTIYIFLKSNNAAGTASTIIPADPTKDVKLDLVNDITPTTFTFHYGDTVTQTVPVGTYYLEGYGDVTINVDSTTYIEFDNK